MRLIRSVCWSFLVALLLCTACAKERFAIGKGQPSHEIAQCITLSEKKRFEEAVQCLEIFKSRFAGTPEAQEAELRIGDSHYQRKEYLLAAETYEAFLKLYPTSSKGDYAHYRVGLSYLMASPKAIDRDQGFMDEALKSFETVLTQYPQSPYLDAARQQRAIVRARLGRRHFYVGNFYYRTGEYKAAVPRLMEVLLNYPETNRLEETAYKVVAAHVRLGEIEEAKAIYARMDQAFSDSPWTKRAERILLKKARVMTDGDTTRPGKNS
ncbi:MAG: outer membrane protein assembly factor BamD [Deltaproteobacteria bacterium]|nr:outer membrane protein assembly factor BamD [Deltaproteobacteria bacterium]